MIQSREKILRSVGISASLAAMSTLASVIIPLDAQSTSQLRALPGCFCPYEKMHIDSTSYFQTSAMMATVMETIMGCDKIRLRADLPDLSRVQWSMEECVYRCTRGGELPVCNVDAGLSFAHSPEELAYLSNLENPLHQYSKGLIASRPNSFLDSISSTYNGSWGVGDTVESFSAAAAAAKDTNCSDDRSSTQLFSNLLFSRSRASTGIGISIVC